MPLHATSIFRALPVAMVSTFVSFISPRGSNLREFAEVKVRTLL